MYETILACDPEGLAEAAAPVVARIATEHASDVRVVGVQDPGAEPAVRPVTEGWLDRVVLELQAHGVASRAELRQAGRRTVANELAAAAHAFGAELIVLGTHHRGELSGLIVASAGHALAARVDTPIMFVSAQRGAATSETSEAAPLWAQPPRAADLRRVLLAIDRTEGSQAAVHAVAGLASPGAEALAVHVRGPEPEDEAQDLLGGAVRVLEQAGTTEPGGLPPRSGTQRQWRQLTCPG